MKIANFIIIFTSNNINKTIKLTFTLMYRISIQNIGKSNVFNKNKIIIFLVFLVKID